MARLFIALVAVAILAMGGVAGLQAGLERAGEDHSISNETWTPDAGNVTQLDDSGISGAYYVNDEETTVYDENGNLTEEGTDYEWFAGNGTVKALSGGALDGDASATISYGYQETTAEQRGFASILGQIPRVMGYALPFGVLLLFLVVLRGG